jgi:hypothetical protein
MAQEGEHVEIDETALRGLIEESRDTHADGVRAAREPLADMVDLGHQARAGASTDPDENRAFARENRSRLAATARRAGGLLGAGGVIAAIADLVGSPAFASSNTDVQVLQTASSIEVLAISTYKTALSLPYIGGSAANPVIKAFATTTMSQHADHQKAWNAVLTAAGKKPVTAVDPVVQPTINTAFAKVTNVAGLAELALMVENIAGETYQNGLAVISSAAGIKTAASIEPVEFQHAAILSFVLGKYPVPSAFTAVSLARPPSDYA